MGKVDINAPIEDNLKAVAQALGKDICDLVAIVLDRDRHQKIIHDIRKAGARIRLISDGDVAQRSTRLFPIPAWISCLVPAVPRKAYWPLWR